MVCNDVLTYHGLCIESQDTYVSVIAFNINVVSRVCESDTEYRFKADESCRNSQNKYQKTSTINDA